MTCVTTVLHIRLGNRSSSGNYFPGTRMMFGVQLPDSNYIIAIQNTDERWGSFVVPTTPHEAFPASHSHLISLIAHPALNSSHEHGCLGSVSRARNGVRDLQRAGVTSMAIDCSHVVPRAVWRKENYS